MALNKDILGTDLYNIRHVFDGKTLDDLIGEYGSLEAARLEVCKREAEAIINHIKNFAQINATVGVGLAASTFPVEGLSAVNIIE